MRDIYLISAKTIKSSSLINDNVDECYIEPAIVTAQDMGLQPLIGTKLFEKLQSLVLDGNGTISGDTDYKYLLDEYIEPYLLNKVTADIQLDLAYKFRNQGVIQSNSEYSNNQSLKDIQLIVENYENKANFYGMRLSKYLLANKAKYPEYFETDSCADMPSNPNAFNKHIYLGRR